MYTYLKLILLYPYPYQDETRIICFIIFLLFALSAYGIYRLIIWKLNAKVKTTFHGFLKIAGISIGVLFFAEVTVSLITMHYVNKQLGFNYATPDTPEEEIFEIIRVDPGKTMENAGLRRCDQVQMDAVNDFYKLLIDNQGKEVVFPVLRDKKKIMIRVKVPEMDVPFNSVSFLF